MEIKPIFPVLLLFFFFSSLTPILSNVVPSSAVINLWCKKTPNPGTCNYFMSKKLKDFKIPKSKSEFRKLLVELAVDRAVDAQSHNQWLGSRCRNHKEKAAWTDCVKLYDETILNLNQTLNPETKCTDYDIQTWLSTALTNLETCRAGFVELGVPDYILPLMSNNVSQLISNTLAMKDDDYNDKSSYGGVPQTYYDEGFPRWVKPGDRKLLQSGSTRPDVVVAQDGSGNFITIKKAIDEAGRRSGSGRFVIRVKSGVYKENLEIGKKLKNIMLVGDSMRTTVITGSRSVVGGSTTFNSATVDESVEIRSFHLLYDDITSVGI